jgi:nickel transport protein
MPAQASFFSIHGKDLTMRHVLALGILIGTTSLANAHASWIAQRAGDWAVVHGQGATDEAYDPAKVTAVTGFDATGNPVAVEVKPQAKNVLLAPAEGAAVLSTVWDEGWWTEDAKGEWHNKPAAEVADFKTTGKYVTYVVSYIGLTDAQKPVGHRLEIVPLSDPGKLTMGDKLKVQVLLDGAPMKGVAVTNDVLTDWDIHSGLTDAEGKTVVTIANAGLNVAQVYHEIASGDQSIEGLQAVLSFTSGLSNEE